MEDKAIQHVLIASIERPPQPRTTFNEESQVGLARSTSEVGQLAPVHLYRRGNTLRLLDGARRIDALIRRGEQTVAAITDDRELSDAEVLHYQLVLDCQKEHLTAVERAKAIQALMQESGWTASQVAQRIGISPATVTKLLAVLELPDEAQEQIAAGTLGMSTAYAIARTGDAEIRAALISDATNGHLTRSSVTERTRSRKSKRRRATRGRSLAQGDRCVIPLGEDCSILVGTPTITLQTLSEILQDLLRRIGGLAQDMQLAEAVQALARKESFP